MQWYTLHERGARRGWKKMDADDRPLFTHEPQIKAGQFDMMPAGVVVAVSLGDDPNDMPGYPGRWEKKAALWERVE